MSLVSPAGLLAVNLLDPRSLLTTFGTLGVAVVLFAETGLLVGLFLPGDSLLFTAGVLSATKAVPTVHLHLGWVLVAAAAGALCGAQAGFLLGRRAGPRLLNRPGRRLDEAVRRTRALLDRYGVAKAVVLTRFVPLARTVVSPLAGVLDVPMRAFTLWQVLGGLAWSLGVTLAGWGLGSHIHNVDHYLLPLVALIVAVSLVPRRARTASRRPHP